MEILSPAGDPERLDMALTYGADAVYLAGKRFGMRAAAGNFSDVEMIEAVKLCRAKGAKIYVTCNATLRNDEISLLPPFIESLAFAGVDAVIVADLGVLALAKKYAPNLRIHVSTQAGIMNYESARMVADMGASRAILARELTIDEIAEIRIKTPADLELESFVHGSMCVSISGRCLLSNYLTGRDANRGDCAQPCRWKYHLIEEKRPGELMEISEEGGTHILNSKDLCMIDHIGQLMETGIYSMKIEGRMKSAYYAAVITNAYRHAADAAMCGEKIAPIWREEVNKVSHRAYSTGFFFDKNGPGQFYENALYFSECDVMAVVESCDEHGNAALTQRNKFYKGDVLELLTPSDEPVKFTAEYIYDGDNHEIDATPHPMMKLRLQLPRKAPKNSILRKYK